MKKSFLSILFLIIIFLTPSFAGAHVKWFTKLEPEKISIEQILSPLFISVALLSAVILALLPQIMDKLLVIPFAKKLDTKLSDWRKYSRYILKYGTALCLTIQVISGTMFAPEFHIEHTWQMIFMWMTIGALVIPSNYATKLGATMMFILFSYIWINTGWFHMLDYGFYIAIIGVLLIGHTKFENWGFPFLYLGTGLSLCWVAVEKWVYPSMTLDIIHHHGVPTFGFDPVSFTVLAAFIEFLIGYLLVIGILNRLLGLVVTIVFVLTTMLFGVTEVIGHAMIHVILVIFIIEGVSFYQPPIKIHKTRWDQMIFVFLNFIFVLSTFLLIYYRFA